MLVDDLEPTYGDGSVPMHVVKHAGVRSDVAIDANTGLFPPLDCVNEDRGTYADAAYDNGIDLLPDSTETARAQLPEVFPAVTDRFAPHLANIGWYLVDEPDFDAIPYVIRIPPATLKAEHDAARTRTTLPITALLQHAHYDTTDAPYAPALDSPTRSRRSRGTST